MAEACQIAKESSHLEGFKWWWEFPGVNVSTATLTSHLHGALCLSIWDWQESNTKSPIWEAVGSSPISLYALSFFMFKSKEQICTLSSTRSCWGGYNKQHVVLHHTLLWERNSSRSGLKQDTTLFKMRLYSVWVSPVKANAVTHFPLFFRVFYLIITAIGKSAIRNFFCASNKIFWSPYNATCTSGGCLQWCGGAASSVPAEGPASPGMFVGKSAAAHVSGFRVPVEC